MKYFSSDWHLDHEKTLEFNGRPFRTIEGMNLSIIKNMTDAVKKGDMFYFLGDISWQPAMIDIVLEKFAKKKVPFIWILGNHDKRYEKQYADRIKQFNKNNAMYDMLEVKLTDAEGKHYPTILCHYPMLTWNKSHYNSFLLFGHHHKTTWQHEAIHGYEQSGKKLNVCCEFHNFKPVSELEVIEIMRTRPDNWDIIKKEKI